MTSKTNSNKKGDFKMHNQQNNGMPLGDQNPFGFNPNFGMPVKTPEEILDKQLFEAYWSTVEEVIKSFRLTRHQYWTTGGLDDSVLQQPFTNIIKALSQYAVWEHKGLETYFSETK